MFKARRTIAGAAGAILTVTLGACSSSEESDASGTSTSQTPSDAPSTAFTPQDVPDPGEDLLSNIRLGKKFSGSLVKASWKFPTSYESDNLETEKAYTADDHYRISIQPGSGDQAAAAAAMENAQRQAEAKGQKTSLNTVTVKGRQFAVLVQDTPEAGILTYAHAPEGDTKFYIIQLASDMSLADIPQEQLDAFQQTLGSLEFERA
jgi:hypothetical protein